MTFASRLILVLLPLGFSQGAVAKPSTALPIPTSPFPASSSPTAAHPSAGSASAAAVADAHQDTVIVAVPERGSRASQTPRAEIKSKRKRTAKAMKKAPTRLASRSGKRAR